MDLGNKIRKHREQLNLTIKEVAENIGVTPSLVSQIERNLANPSLSTLKKISDALNVPLAYLFSDEENSSPVVRKNQRRKIVAGENNSVTEELLTPDVNNNFEFLYITYQPGVTSDGFLSHVGEECGLVISGVLELTLGTEVYVLNEGDSIYFRSDIPHQFRNIGEVPLCLAWVITPASF